MSVASATEKPVPEECLHNLRFVCQLKKKLALSKILCWTFLWPQCTVTITILRTGRMRAVKKSDIRQILEHIFQGSVRCHKKQGSINIPYQ
jgi:hypothetical protein